MRAMLEVPTAIKDGGDAAGDRDGDAEMQDSRSACKVEKGEEAEKIDEAASRFRTWRGLQNVL